jgi:hypothetical protein
MKLKAVQLEATLCQTSEYGFILVVVFEILIGARGTTNTQVVEKKNKSDMETENTQHALMLEKFITKLPGRSQVVPIAAELSRDG